MAIKFPDSMDELVYFTKRKNDNGMVTAWVYRQNCPECDKALMGKPIKPDGKPKVRAVYYECPECKHKIPKSAYEDSLTAEIDYTCPHCAHKGEAEIPFKRKKFKGVEALVFSCAGCNEKIAVTKKMKDPKK